MTATVKDITTIQTGFFAKPIGKGNVVYLQSKHFDEFGRLTAALYPDLNAADISEKHLLNAGDILFAAKGFKNFATVFESSNPTAVASTSFFVLRLTDKNILPEYLAWFLNHQKTQAFLKGKAKGTSIPSITKSVLESLEIGIPSLEKQKLIIRLAELALQESELRAKILTRRKLLIEQQIINAIKEIP